MFEAYILPVLIFAVIGLLAGILLTAASKIFAVKIDPRIEKVAEALPQINCGACGHKGCADYARAIVEKGERVNLCRPGGNKTAEKVAEIMGVAAKDAKQAAAIVRCKGNCDTEHIDFGFNGISSCRSAKRFYGGMWGCKYGCLGQGDCAEICPANAIDIKNGLAEVDPEKCIGCELCTKTCPNGIIEMRELHAGAEVLCSSHDFGKNVKAVCTAGCIACRICEKNCNYGAIRVSDNLARVDHDKCTACGECVKKCPVKVIILQ